MFYKKITFFKRSYAENLCKRSVNAPWFNGWMEKYNYVFRNDLSTSFYDVDTWDKIRRQIHSTFVEPVDWIYKPFRIQKFPPGGIHDWHSDRIDIKNTSSVMTSIRSSVVIIQLRAGTGLTIETDKCQYKLKSGSGIHFPIDAQFRITVPKKENFIYENDYAWVLTAWCMQRLRFIKQE